MKLHVPRKSLILPNQGLLVPRRLGSRRSDPPNRLCSIELFDDYRGVTSVPSDGAALLNNLISFWEFDDALGMLVDSHGNNDLTGDNTPTQATGKVGEGLHVVSASSQAAHVAHTSLDLGNVDQSYCGWINADSLPAVFPRILQKWLGSAGGVRIRIDEGQQALQAFLYDSGGGTAVSVTHNGVNIGTATWYFICVWFDAALGRLFVSVNDGTPEFADKSTDPSADTTALYLGDPSGQGFDGVIDQFMIASRKWTDAERTWLFNSGAGRAYSQLG